MMPGAMAAPATAVNVRDSGNPEVAVLGETAHVTTTMLGVMAVPATAEHVRDSGGTDMPSLRTQTQPTKLCKLLRYFWRTLDVKSHEFSGALWWLEEPFLLIRVFLQSGSMFGFVFCTFHVLFLQSCESRCS